MSQAVFLLLSLLCRPGFLAKLAQYMVCSVTTVAAAAVNWPFLPLRQLEPKASVRYKTTKTMML